MARPRKPASLNLSKKYTKAEKEEMAEMEEQLKGNFDDVKHIPEHLDELGQQYYKFIVEELEVSSLLSNLDIPLIEQTADSLSKMRQADEIINEEGIMLKEYDRNGHEVRKEHPMVNTKDKYQKQFRALSTQLGMSPSSRAELAALKIENNEKEQDPLMNLLAARGGA